MQSTNIVSPHQISWLVNIELTYATFRFGFVSTYQSEITNKSLGVQIMNATLTWC